MVSTKCKKKFLNAILKTVEQVNTGITSRQILLALKEQRKHNGLHFGRGRMWLSVQRISTFCRTLQNMNLLKSELIYEKQLRRANRKWKLVKK